MKIKTDFVTNSSSNNFVVEFLHKPTNVEDLQQLLNLPKEILFEDFRENDVTLKEIATFLWNELQTTDLNFEKFESLANFYIEHEFENPYYFWNNQAEEAKKFFKMQHFAKNDFHKNQLENPLNSDGTFTAYFIFHSNDEESCQEVCHDGEPFKYLPHSIISNH